MAVQFSGKKRYVTLEVEWPLLSHSSSCSRYPIFIECTGRVFIGELDANKTIRTQERYVFNVNYDVSTLYIPVAVQLFNTTSQAPCNSYTSNVSIIIIK